MTNKKTNRKSSAGGNRNTMKRQTPPSRKRVNVSSGNLRKADNIFHLKLKQLLGGISLLSLLAAFEVFSIPAANGIIDIFGFTKIMAGIIWVGVALLSGGAALYLHEEEKDK